MGLEEVKAQSMKREKSMPGCRKYLKATRTYEEYALSPSVTSSKNILLKLLVYSSSTAAYIPNLPPYVTLDML
ncbi:predicted protein [Sclerotinia sclerotiorum 1980 UF-70]|uniref:Uncharacterized protein n=1 Tax=Sclerotinia sclerotiorum (strain ATCC 18683 / 1980 / Ss-1) TaxID=665079 RepID=A7ENE8_SCLS1|nr:predicted protein [Sclerotinia sclerotiorum 1980 UF-70]EDO04364.1 predicted protein [Sclerotinia sclerotiorum 1980 UF-70]